MLRPLLALSLLPLAACSTIAPTGVIASPARDWRQEATPADRQRLRGWRTAFVSGLRQAEAAGHGDRVRAEGVLLQPDAAQGGAGLPNGDYRCRVVKLGARSGGMLPFVAYPAFTCRVRAEGRLQAFAKLTGSQRQIGLIFPGDQLRQVFLGTLVLGDEGRAMRYGADQERDLAGFVERIGPNRWRLVLPSPRYESLVDVVELVPAGTPANAATR
jgi:hypothetical protein